MFPSDGNKCTFYFGVCKIGTDYRNIQLSVTEEECALWSPGSFFYTIKLCICGSLSISHSDTRCLASDANELYHIIYIRIYCISSQCANTATSIFGDINNFVNKVPSSLNLNIRKNLYRCLLRHEGTLGVVRDRRLSWAEVGSISYGPSAMASYIHYLPNNDNLFVWLIFGPYPVSAYGSWDKHCYKRFKSRMKRQRNQFNIVIFSLRFIGTP